MAILVASFHANLFIAELAERTVGHLRVKTALEIRRETREHFVAELTPAAEIFRAIAAVKGHVEPFNLQRSVGVWDVQAETYQCLRPFRVDGDVRNDGAWHREQKGI